MKQWNMKRKLTKANQWGKKPQDKWKEQRPTHSNIWGTYKSTKVKPIIYVQGIIPHMVQTHFAPVLGSSMFMFSYEFYWIDFQGLVLLVSSSPLLLIFIPPSLLKGPLNSEGRYFVRGYWVAVSMSPQGSERMLYQGGRLRKIWRWINKLSHKFFQASLFILLFLF